MIVLIIQLLDEKNNYKKWSMWKSSFLPALCNLDLGKRRYVGDSRNRGSLPLEINQGITSLNSLDMELQHPTFLKWLGILTV